MRKDKGCIGGITKIYLFSLDEKGVRKIFTSKNVFQTMKTNAGVLAVRKVSLKKYVRHYCRVNLRYVTYPPTSKNASCNIARGEHVRCTTLFYIYGNHRFTIPQRYNGLTRLSFTSFQRGDSKASWLSLSYCLAPTDSSLQRFKS